MVRNVTPKVTFDAKLSSEPQLTVRAYSIFLLHRWSYPDVPFAFFADARPYLASCPRPPNAEPPSHVVEGQPSRTNPEKDFQKHTFNKASTSGLRIDFVSIPGGICGGHLPQMAN